MTYIPILVIMILMPTLMIFWNRQRIKGKLLCFIVKNDKSVLPKLCELRDNFVIFANRGYEVYPDFVRLCRYPMGWPSFLQELVPTMLLDEDDRVPLDWITIGDRQGSSMELKSALDDNWVRKLVAEASRESGVAGINWRKVLPYLLIGVGIIGLIAMFALKGCG